ncbi:MAG TPA: SPFH domain-containing protein, partial [Pirellulales bacterium]|nr:SPFH domain-containing protein [Pirellulales bacterium]
MINLLKQSKFWTTSIAVIVALGIVYLLWQWEVERIEVGPGKYLVRIHRWGKNLSEGEIVAPDPSYKGVMFEVLPEGRHFLNPLFWSHEVHQMVHVPVGKCLVLTRQFGRDIPEERLTVGDILAHQDNDNPIDGERGILREVLLPGSYRLNPYAYAWEEVPAVEVRVEQVGVRCLKVGQDPRKLSPDPARGNYVVPDGYRGVQQTPVSPGTYYINPFVETITPIEVRSHRVELTDIEFPSRDGFIIKPQVVVEYAVRPEKAPELLVRLTDEGVIHQADSSDKEKEANEVLQKVLLPHIRGYARIEGSNFDARDFILVQSEAGDTKTTNAREALQRTLLSKVKPRCAELGVEIRAVTLADLRPPEELADQIAQRELARVEREKNQVRLKQFQAEQELKGKESLKQQAAEKVNAETRLVQGKTKSE